MMKQGGNKPIRDFFSKMQIENSPIVLLYRSKAATHYREHLKEHAEKVIAGIVPPDHKPMKITKTKINSTENNYNEKSKKALRDIHETFEVTFSDGPMGMTLQKDFEGEALVSRVISAGAAANVGIQVGDKVIGVAGKLLRDYEEIMHMIPYMSRPLKLKIERFKASPRLDSATETSPVSSSVTAPTSEYSPPSQFTAAKKVAPAYKFQATSDPNPSKRSSISPAAVPPSPIPSPLVANHSTSSLSPSTSFVALPATSTLQPSSNNVKPVEVPSVQKPTVPKLRVSKKQKENTSKDQPDDLPLPPKLTKLISRPKSSTDVVNENKESCTASSMSEGTSNSAMNTEVSSVGSVDVHMSSLSVAEGVTSASEEKNADASTENAVNQSVEEITSATIGTPSDAVNQDNEGRDALSDRGPEVTADGQQEESVHDEVEEEEEEEVEEHEEEEEEEDEKEEVEEEEEEEEEEDGDGEDDDGGERKEDEQDPAKDASEAVVGAVDEELELQHAVDPLLIFLEVMRSILPVLDAYYFILFLIGWGDCEGVAQ